MSKKPTLHDIYVVYKRWVINNPNLVTDLETIATWSSYFVVGKINKSPIISELVYCISKLVSLFNDRLISEAYTPEVQLYSLREQIKLWLTILHYCEVFFELIAKENFRTRGKWTVVTLLQLFKCLSALILMLRFKELPVCHPPLAALQRKSVTEDKSTDENSFFILRRSQRVMRRIEGAPPVAFRDWQPVQARHQRPNPNTDVKDLLYAESLHILKPLIHLTAMRIFGTKSWKQWLVALSLDLTSIRLFNRYAKDLSYQQKLEISKRKLGLILYLLRSPVYNGYSKFILENILKSAAKTIPMMDILCAPIIQYLDHWQDIYFYMWAN